MIHFNASCYIIVKGLPTIRKYGIHVKKSTVLCAKRGDIFLDIFFGRASPACALDLTGLP